VRAVLQTDLCRPREGRDRSIRRSALQGVEGQLEGGDQLVLRDDRVDRAPGVAEEPINQEQPGDRDRAGAVAKASSEVDQKVRMVAESDLVERKRARANCAGRLALDPNEDPGKRRTLTA
jgi:hypothetical protein